MDSREKEKRHTRINSEDSWSSDAGAEFVDKWFSIPKICQYFRTRSPVTMADIDGWHARDSIATLFFHDNTDLQDGGIRPILCGEIWRRCFASLAVNATPIRKEAAKFFTSTYDNFIQTAGIRDGASHCAKTLSVFYDNLDASDPNDPDVIIKIDVSNALNTTDRACTLDMISGRASRDYACGFKRGDVIPTVDTLTNLFGYFKAMRTCHSKLRYFDWDGQVHLAKGKTGGQQGGGLEMLIFNLTIHHLWGRVLAKFQEARAIDMLTTDTLKPNYLWPFRCWLSLRPFSKEMLAWSSMSLRQHAAGCVCCVTQQAVFDVAHSIFDTSPALMHLRAEIALDSFCPEAFVGIGVPIGTDAFVRNFVAKTCRDIIDYVEKLDAIYTLFRMSLFSTNFSDFASPPDSSILICILCLIIVVFCSSSM
jgi:hypothetical protein